MSWYVLKDGEALPASELEYAVWLRLGAKNGSHVAETGLPPKPKKRKPGEPIEPGIWISTIFLGWDTDPARPASPGPDYRPLTFRTMVFGGPLDGTQEFYRTLPEARAGHERLAERAREAALAAD